MHYDSIRITNKQKISNLQKKSSNSRFIAIILLTREPVQKTSPETAENTNTCSWDPAYRPRSAFSPYGTSSGLWRDAPAGRDGSIPYCPLLVQIFTFA